MSTEYSEDILIEKPAIEIFESLGYSNLNCFDETYGDNSTLGRETSSDVVLIVGVIIVVAASAVVDSVPDFAAAGIAGAVGIVAVGVIYN